MKGVIYLTRSLHHFVFSVRKSLFLVHLSFYYLNAGIVNFKFKDFYAAVEDLSECLKVDGCNTSAYTYLVSFLLAWF